MTRQEFIDRTGFEITEESMWALHEVYSISPIDKNAFCEMCVKGGGSLVDYFVSLGSSIVAERHAAMKDAVAPYEAAKSHYEEENANLKDIYEARIANKEEDITTLNKELEELQQFIFKTSLNDDYEIKDELKDKCKELYGEAEFYAMMLEDAEDLDSFSSEDLKNIAELLRR